MVSQSGAAALLASALPMRANADVSVFQAQAGGALRAFALVPHVARPAVGDAGAWAARGRAQRREQGRRQGRGRGRGRRGRKGKKLGEEDKQGDEVEGEEVEGEEEEGEEEEEEEEGGGSGSATMMADRHVAWRREHDAFGVTFRAGHAPSCARMDCSLTFDTAEEGEGGGHYQSGVTDQV